MKKTFLFFSFFLTVFTALPAQTCTLKASVDSLKHVSCYGRADGAIFLKVANAQYPVSFTFGGVNQPSGNLFNLRAGLYNITVTDNTGCRDTVLNIKIKEDTPKITITTIPATNGVNGKATVTIIKKLDTLVREFINLKLGINNVFVADSQGCGYTLTVTITGATASNELNTEGLEKFDLVQNAANNVAVSIGFSESKAFDLSVFTVNGQCVLTQSFKQKDVLFNFKTPDVATGLLLFQLKIKDKTSVKKLVLK
jgi:hypothetical protein